MTGTAARRVKGYPTATIMIALILLILATAALRLGAGLLLPVAIAGLLALLLDQPVRVLKKAGIPTAIGSAAVVFGTIGLLIAGGVRLAGPVADWLEKAPATLVEVQARVRRLLRPLETAAQKVEQAAAPASKGEATPTVQIKPPGLLQRIFGGTASILATLVTVAFLTYFVLVMLPGFRSKVAGLIGTRSGIKHMEEVLAELETQMSRYLLLNTLTSVGVGLATWGFLAAIGLPNSLLFGVAAFVFNFIPYAGALVTLALVGMAAIVGFDGAGKAVLAMVGCVAINLIEGNLVTPYLMGKHLPLNPVAIFLSLLYWGWVWGPVGTVLAVPITVLIQVVSARIDSLRPVAVILDS